MTDITTTARTIRLVQRKQVQPIRVQAGTAHRIRDVQQRQVIAGNATERDLVVHDTKAVLVDTGGKQGIQGPQGPAGPAGGTSAAFPVGTTIHGLRAVRAEDGLLYHPDLSVVEHAKQTFGIALQSASTGEVNVQLSGQLTEPSWSWSPGFVYVGADGQLVQPAPATGWLLAIGRATSATTINIDIDTPFVRA